MARSRRSRRSSRGRRRSRVGDYGRSLYSRARMNPYRAAGYGALGAAGLGALGLGARAYRKYRRSIAKPKGAGWRQFRKGNRVAASAMDIDYENDPFAQDYTVQDAKPSPPDPKFLPSAQPYMHIPGSQRRRRSRRSRRSRRRSRR